MSSRGVLRELVKETKVTDFVSYAKFLGVVYKKAQAAIENYSYLKFAADLGFPETNVVRLIINGKRPLSRAGALRIIRALLLKGVERRYLLLLVEYANARLSIDREQLFRDLLAQKSTSLPTVEHQKALEYFSEWYNPVIRELVARKDFDPDPAWIASRLYAKLMPKEIKKSFELLQNLGLISFDRETNRFVQSGGQIRNDRQVSVMAAIRYHQRMIELGKESITMVPEGRRDINALTVNVTNETAALIKQKVSEFCQAILKLEEQNQGGDQVYQLNIQLFPFTKA